MPDTKNVVRLGRYMPKSHYLINPTDACFCSCLNYIFRMRLTIMTIANEYSQLSENSNYE